MDPAEFTNLPRALSTARLQPFLDACGQDARQAVRLYTWNAEVSSAFWGTVHVLEVALRNAQHDQMRARYQRVDWWNDPAVQLHKVMSDQLQRANKDAAKVAGKNRRAVVADDVVAALTFGFWSGLLGAGGGLQYETRYWQPFLHQAFPGFSGKRAFLHRQIDSLRLFRNRLAHHEPVFRRHLAADHASILTVAGYIDPDVEGYIDSHSRVPETLSRRHRAVNKGYATSF